MTQNKIPYWMPEIMVAKTSNAMKSSSYIFLCMAKGKVKKLR